MEQYFTVEEAATLMKVSTETVRRWLRVGTVQGLKHGRDWRIPESALCTCGCEKCTDRDSVPHQHLVEARKAEAQSAGAQNSPATTIAEVEAEAIVVAGSADLNSSN
jgi:excisionase family DNA binding protein